MYAFRIFRYAKIEDATEVPYRCRNVIKRTAYAKCMVFSFVCSYSMPISNAHMHGDTCLSIPAISSHFRFSTMASARFVMSPATDLACNKHVASMQQGNYLSSVCQTHTSHHQEYNTHHDQGQRDARSVRHAVLSVSNVEGAMS